MIPALLVSLVAVMIALACSWWRYEQDSNAKWDRLAHLPRDENDGAC